MSDKVAENPDRTGKPTAELGPPRRWITAAIVAVAVFCLALLALPKAPSLSASTTGDQALAQRVRQLTGDPAGYQSLMVAQVTTDSVTTAGLGDIGTRPGQPNARTRYQLGSITKTFNGMLLADAVDRGEVRLDQPVAELVPELAGSDVGAVTLVELATHRSGLPSLLPGTGSTALLHPFTLRDPYATTTTEALIAELKTYRPQSRGSVEYSNTGAALLGHALARASHSPDWPTLVKTRLFDPLGMTDTGFCARADEVPADGAIGYNTSGRVPEPWCSQGQAPAGTSTWTTAADLARYAQALLTKQAPGMTALDPVAQAGSPDRHFGLYWLISEEPDSPVITWHNGGVAGGKTFLGLDRTLGKAVIVLGNSDRDVSQIGYNLLTDRPEPIGWSQRAESEIPSLVALALAVMSVINLGWRAVKASARTKLISGILDCCTLLTLTFVFAPWTSVPWVLLPLLIALVVAGIAVAVARWRQIPLVDRPGGWVAVGFSSLFFLAVVGVMVFG